jgi:N-acyl-D-aspartate/D-glutamate deacylase
MAPDARWVIRNGTVYDGGGGDGRAADVVVEGGRVAGLVPRDTVVDAVPVDASGCWVTPGFVDLHTHYDAELEVAPGLPESVRHGVTTVVVGSCGLSMAVGDPVDLADMFCRVEGIPRSTVKPLLERTKDWATPADYLDHLGRLPLGANVAALLGHSAIRAHAMGLRRSLTRGVRPTAAEMAAMERLLADALDAGYLGLSINTLSWDKMDGDGDLRSRPTPSVFATWREYRRLTRILRARGRILQGVPNVSTKVNVLLFLLESTGLGRRGLKTMLITMLDAKAARLPFRLAGLLSNALNRFARADVRFQSLPNVFDLWIDGIDAPVFEEIAAGSAALTAKGAARAALLRDPAFRRRFRRQWASALLGRAYHRDLDDTEILECPDGALVGQSLGAVARSRGADPVACLFDLVAEHRERLRL